MCNTARKSGWCVLCCARQKYICNHVHARTHRQTDRRSSFSHCCHCVSCNRWCRYGKRLLNMMWIYQLLVSLSSFIVLSADFQRLRWMTECVTTVARLEAMALAPQCPLAFYFSWHQSRCYVLRQTLGEVFRSYQEVWRMVDVQTLAVTFAFEKAFQQRQAVECSVLCVSASLKQLYR